MRRQGISSRLDSQSRSNQAITTMALRRLWRFSLAEDDCAVGRFLVPRFPFSLAFLDPFHVPPDSIALANGIFCETGIPVSGTREAADREKYKQQLHEQKKSAAIARARALFVFMRVHHQSSRRGSVSQSTTRSIPSRMTSGLPITKRIFCLG
jgi:hypothetical protein